MTADTYDPFAAWRGSPEERFVATLLYDRPHDDLDAILATLKRRMYAMVEDALSTYQSRS